MIEHLSKEQLGNLVHGRLESHATLRHLSWCPDCFRAYRAAVESLEETKRLETLEVSSVDLSVESDPGSGREGLRWLRLAIPAVTVLAVGAAALWAVSSRSLDPYSITYSSPVQQAVNHASSMDLVLVGGEGAADRGGAAFRNGVEIPADELNLPEISRSYRNRHSVETGLEVVSGYLALNKIQTAERFLQTVQRDHAEDPRVRLLEGIVSWKSNSSLEEVDRIFVDLLEDHPDYRTVRLDYAMILRETGRASEAQTLFEDLAESARNTPLGRRAAMELEAVNG